METPGAGGPGGGRYRIVQTSRSIVDKAIYESSGIDILVDDAERIRRPSIRSRTPDEDGTDLPGRRPCDVCSG